MLRKTQGFCQSILLLATLILVLLRLHNNHSNGLPTNGLRWFAETNPKTPSQIIIKSCNSIPANEYVDEKN